MPAAKGSARTPLGPTEDVSNANCESNRNYDEIVKPKSEPVELDEEGSEMKEMSKLKAFIEDNLVMIGDLKNRNRDLESNLNNPKRVKEESPKGREVPEDALER